MPRKSKATPPLDHTDARMQAQIKKLQAVFADQLVDAFHALVTKSARAGEGSPLAMLTLAQLDELLLCLHETVTTPPPEFEAALSGALNDDDEPPKESA